MAGVGLRFIHAPCYDMPYTTFPGYFPPKQDLSCPCTLRYGEQSFLASLFLPSYTLDTVLYLSQTPLPLVASMLLSCRRKQPVDLSCACCNSCVSLLLLPSSLCAPGSKLSLLIDYSLVDCMALMVYALLLLRNNECFTCSSIILFLLL